MYVHSLTLTNIKAFETLNLAFEHSPSSKYAGVNVLVGGNSSGKSTILKAIAMAISGPLVASQQLVSPAGWLRKGEQKGFIELQLLWDQKVDQFKDKGGAPTNKMIQAGLVFEADNNDSPATLKGRRYQSINRTKIRSAERGPWHSDASGWHLSGYGPLRRLTGSSTEALRYALAKGKLASTVSLFREDVALTESETWLKQEYARALERKSEGQESSSIVDDVLKLLNDGLLPGGFSISKVTVDHVHMQTPNGGELALRDLSDGIRSIYALMLDIVHEMATVYGTKDLFAIDDDGKPFISRPGVILIDEIEAHLHPSWQRKVCGWLRERFPKVQFFLTTHSPLVVQSADEGGIYVLRMPDEGQDLYPRQLTSSEQQKITLGRAEKVLLGEAFGLAHTWSERADRLVKRWQELEALKQTSKGLSQSERGEYDQLKPQVELVFDMPSKE